MKGNVSNESVKEAISIIMKRFRGAEMAAKMENRTNEYEKMMHVLDEVSDLLLDANNIHSSIPEGPFKTTIGGIRSTLLSAIQAASNGPQGSIELGNAALAIAKSLDDATTSGGTAGIMAFNRTTKKFENPPDQLRDAVRRAEAKLSMIDEPTQDDVINALREEIIGSGIRAETCDCPECRDEMQKKATVLGNGTKH